jgi:hypothetical protein
MLGRVSPEEPRTWSPLLEPRWASPKEEPSGMSLTTSGPIWMLTGGQLREADQRAADDLVDLDDRGHVDTLLSWGTA